MGRSAMGLRGLDRPVSAMMPGATTAPADRAGRIGELDAIRGVAAVAVVAYHFWPRSVPFGWAAVDVFFVLSGYLITGIILEHGHRPGFLTRFYARRSLRIWPIYYLALGALLLVNPWLRSPARMDGWPYFLTYTQNIQGYWLAQPPPFSPAFGHTWSLAVEEQFYLVWPALILLLGRRVVPMALGLVAVAVGMRAAGFSSFLLLARCDGLALGGLLAALSARLETPSARSRCGRALALLAAVLFATVAALHLGVRGSHSMAQAPAFRSVKVLAINLLWFSLIGLVVLHRGQRSQAPLRDARLRYLGQISYGIYLYHMPAALLVAEAAGRLGLGEPGWLAFVGAAVGLGLAVLSWRYVEAPILALKDRFDYRAVEPALAPLGRPGRRFELLAPAVD